MQYIQLQPQSGATIATPPSGSVNYYLDSTNNKIKLKNAQNVISSSSPYITGGTYSDNAITLVDDTGVVVSITGVTGTVVTGGTYSANTITCNNSAGGSFTITGITDTAVTGGTYSANTITIFNNFGSPVNITGVTGTVVTGGTYSANTITFTNNTGGSFPVTGVTGAVITGGTVNGSTGVLTLRYDNNQPVTITGLSSLEIVETVQTTQVSGTTTATTSVLIYGINHITASSITNFCTRLPLTPQKGKSVTVVNTSSYIVRVFPSVNGGKINNVVNGSFDVPNDGLPYVFICYENPLPGDWGTTSRATSNVNTTVLSEMSINYTGGTVYYAGTSAAIETSVGGGLDGSGNIILTPSSTYWRSENVVATSSMVRVYTNILSSDVSSGEIRINMTTAFKTAANSFTYGSRGVPAIINASGCDYNPASMEYCNMVNGGVLNSPVLVGDAGTMYFELPKQTLIGLGGTFNQFSRYYYIFTIDFKPGVASKLYKFRFEVDYV